MHNLIATALETAGLHWLLVMSLAAGTVYGFAGFGSALIFMPVAVIFLPPASAIAAFSLSAMASLFTIVPKALPLVDRKAVTILIVTAALSSSLGLWVLRVTDATLIRWVVVAICATTLAALLAEWRYALVPSDMTRGVVGLTAGFVGGVSGLLGPVMVLFQLAGRDNAATTRATTAIFLTFTSLLLLPLMYLQGLLDAPSLVLGVMLLVPYGAGCLIGQALFRPELERLYRTVAYMIIAIATLAGLPIWGQS